MEKTPSSKLIACLILLAFLSLQASGAITCTDDHECAKTLICLQSLGYAPVCKQGKCTCNARATVLSKARRCSKDADCRRACRDGLMALCIDRKCFCITK